MENYLLPTELTVYEVMNFKESVYEKINQGQINWSIDFTRCKFIDSTGLGAVVSVFKRLNEVNGKIELIHMNGQVRELFEMTKLDQVMEIVD